MKGKMDNKKNMSISEISCITGIPASTIRFYLREGLISLPNKKGKTRAYYNEDHVMQLRKLKQLRDEKKLSIKEIKKSHSFSRNPANGPIEQYSDLNRKDDIILAAIDLFRTMGYNVSINDIAERLHISKATFYKFFSDKEELFYECADRVFYDIDKEFQELLNEKNIIIRLTIRPSLFIKTHRYMIDMLHLVRGISLGGELKNRLKLNQIIANLTGPIAHDLDEGIRLGLFKKINSIIIAHFLMGAVEYGMYFCDGKNDSAIDELIGTALGLILNGIYRDLNIRDFPPNKHKGFLSGPLSMIKSTNYYKISELSRISSTPIPTIRYYIKEGLLPSAIKTGKTISYYIDDHLARLRLIKKLQVEEQRPLLSIKEKLDQMPPASTHNRNAVIVSSEKRNTILSAAIELFIEKGIVEISIDDIVNKAGIGKDTFYKFFKDKDDLFIQCSDVVFYNMYSHVWNEIKNERDMTNRFFKRREAFFDSYPQWIDIMNLVRYASVGNNPYFKNKYKAVLEQIVKPIAHDIKVLQQEGKIDNNLDCLGLAYMLMGMTEYAAWLMYNSQYKTEEISTALQDLIINGIGRK
jgi:AcrR family transcriptional regulator